MTTNRHAILALLAAVSLNGAVMADEVTDQIQSAQRSYESGQLRAAVETLNFAIAKIQEQMTAGLLKLLPEPLPGWQADAAQSQSGGVAAMITGTNLSRRYVREDGAEVSLSLMADSPMLPMLTMAMSMPFVMQANQDMKTYALKGNRGMIEHAADSDEYEITVMVGSRLVIQGTGTGIADAKPVEQYLEALDLEQIQKSLAN